MEHVLGMDHRCYSSDATRSTSCSEEDDVEEVDRVANIGENMLEAEESAKGGIKSLEQEFMPVAPDDMKPYVGRQFISEAAAIDFYNAYAKICGFSVRKNQRKKYAKTDIVYFRRLSCSQEGERRKIWMENMDRKRPPKRITRVGCPAKLEMRLMDENSWVVTKFVEKHCHKLMTPIKSHLLRSHRNVPGRHLNFISDLQEVGVGSSKAIAYLCQDAGGDENLGYLPRDAWNALRTKKRIKTYGKDAYAVLQYFLKKKEDDPSFFFRIQIDAHATVTSIFWVDHVSQLDYKAFGDVVCFDTTYKTNQYDMPFAPFTGVNHHRQSILFGAGLLFGETIEDFKWLFNTWLDAMGGKQPVAIITDQDPAIRAAIAAVFSESKHRFCMWHILQKVPEKLGHIYRQNSTFGQDFNMCIHKTETIEDFERTWVALVKQYHLESVDWVHQMYKIRHMWVPIFLKDTFFAGMSTTQRSESMNALFDGYVNHYSSLLQFVLGYEKAIKRRRALELQEDGLSAYGFPVPRTIYRMDIELGKIYTKAVFRDVQEELFHTPAQNVKSVDKIGHISTYEVHTWEEKKSRVVIFDEEKVNISCSCHLFEHAGIVCRHSLAVLHTMLGITEMPGKYILRRWTRNAKQGLDVIIDDFQSTVNGDKFGFIQQYKLDRSLRRLRSAAMISKITYDYAKEQIDKLSAEIEEIAIHDTRQNQNTEQNWHINDMVASQVTMGSGPMLSSNNFVLRDPNIVATKGHGTSKRIKSGKETNKGVGRACHTCWKSGHDSRNCPLRTDGDLGRSKGKGKGKVIEQYQFHKSIGEPQ